MCTDTSSNYGKFMMGMSTGWQTWRTWRTGQFSQLSPSHFIADWRFQEMNKTCYKSLIQLNWQHSQKYRNPQENIWWIKSLHFRLPKILLASRYYSSACWLGRITAAFIFFMGFVPSKLQLQLWSVQSTRIPSALQFLIWHLLLVFVRASA